VSASAGNVTAYALLPNGSVRLPPGTAVDMAYVVGNDLYLPQPDGSLIVIIDGAIQMGGIIDIPVILIGNTAFSPDALAALVGGRAPPAPAEGAGGPGGGPAGAAGGADGSAGGDTFGQPGGPIDPRPIGVTELLGPTALLFGVPIQKEITPPANDSDPIAGPNPDVIADDDDLPGGNPGGVNDDAPAHLSGVL